MGSFHTDSVALSYSNVEAAKQWWIDTFGCKVVRVPQDWDNPLPRPILSSFLIGTKMKPNKVVRTRSRGCVFVGGRVSSVNWTGLAKGMPLAEPHSHSDNLPNHFRFLRVAEHPRRHRGKRMGLQDDFLKG